MVTGQQSHSASMLKCSRSFLGRGIKEGSPRRLGTIDIGSNSVRHRLSN
jgi:hypothetical protein